MKTNVRNKQHHWNIEKKRSVGLFTDMQLYIEALREMNIYKSFRKIQIQENLSKKVKGLIYSGSITPKMIDELFREMLYFGWIIQDKKIFILTKTGENIYNFYLNKDIVEYRKSIIIYLQKTYAIPGWFINKLWELNPNRQGEIIIPAPIKSWTPGSRKWEDNIWTTELEEVTLHTLNECNSKCPGSLPIDEVTWVNIVNKSWNRLSNTVRRRKGGNATNNDELMEKYQPRRRLSTAMKEAALYELFNKDTNFIENPISLRTFMVWCPRLAELELLWYSDSFKAIPGRLLFPTSVYRGNNSNGNNFEKIIDMKNPENYDLYFHRWINDSDSFLESLHNIYENIYLSKRIMYVSILDLRDEFCRKYRISAQRFETLLKNNLRSNKYSIALETDIREDQQGGAKQLRRPVVIDNNFYSLIAVTERE